VKLPRDVSGAEALKALARGKQRVSVPMHRNLVIGTLQSILRQAGISVEDSMNAL
jgi:hypothetical protein